MRFLVNLQNGVILCSFLCFQCLKKSSLEAIHDIALAILLRVVACRQLCRELCRNVCNQLRI